MVTSQQDTERATHGPGMVRHIFFGVTALAVAVLDFAIGTGQVIVFGVIALTVAAYSFASAARFRQSPSRRATDDEQNGARPSASAHSTVNPHNPEPGKGR